MKRLRYILQSKYLFKLLVVIFVLIAIIITKFYHFNSKYDINTDIFIGTVIDYKIDDNSISILLKGKEKIIVNYNFNNLVFNKLEYGDTLLVKGRISIPSSSTIFNTFNYKDYLYNKRIYYIVNAKSIDKIKDNSNYFYCFKNIIYNRVNNLKSGNYIKTLLLGDNTLNSDIKESYRINGISHLFSISGMHINIIIGILYWYLDRITYNRNIKFIICDIFLVLYLILCYTSSLLRAGLLFIISSINSIFNFNIDKIDIMCIVLIISICINPFIIYDIGFIYSYLISFFLILSYDMYRDKNIFIKSIYTSINAFIVSFPITVYFFYEVNIFSIIINIFIVPLVSSILIPISIITLLLPIFDTIMFFLISVFESISLYLDNVSLFRLVFCKGSILLVFIYYIIIFGIYKNKKFLYLFVVIIFIHYLYPYFNSNLEITMFDVGEGDSILISFPNNMSNILIDTGSDDGYSIMKNGIITYMKSRGIHKLDYVIITHGDKDHIGGLSNLISSFKVDMVIFNRGNRTEYESDNTKLLDEYHIKYRYGMDKIDIHNIYLYFLNDKLFDNENDNSSVIYFKYLEYRFLFMGDSEYNGEKYIIDNYNISDIFLLKVGHHGSKTSSNKFFIDKINPKYSFISVGRNNIYGHPNNEVLNNLSNSKIYRTDINGSINIKINKSKYMISSMIRDKT